MSVSSISTFSGYKLMCICFPSVTGCHFIFLFVAFKDGQTQKGTTIKFEVRNGGIDTMLNHGLETIVSTRLQCITTMKEYENKSLEVCLTSR